MCRLIPTTPGAHRFHIGGHKSSHHSNTGETPFFRPLRPRNSVLYRLLGFGLESHRSGAGNEPPLRRNAKKSGLCDLHLGIHGKTQRSARRAPPDPELRSRNSRSLRPHARRQLCDGAAVVGGLQSDGHFSAAHLRWRTACFIRGESARRPSVHRLFRAF
jgi:hypothetical protein